MDFFTYLIVLGLLLQFIDPVRKEDKTPEEELGSALTKYLTSIKKLLSK